jgi:AraC-like DNA-binding protein
VASLKRYEYERGWMEVASRLPRPELARHVRRYWGILERATAPVRRREVPSQDIVTILSFGPSIRVNDAPRTSFVAGLADSSVVTEHGGDSHGIEVNFTPLGARMILGFPMHVFANEVVPFEDVWGRRATAELLERLHAAPDWDARFDLLEALLTARLARATAPPAAVDWAWRRLVHEHGRLAVHELTRELGCSRRYLATQFREHVGLPPKATARILRFQRAVELLENGKPHLERMALDCGYYDQAHFNRDFRTFAGSTPTEFLARIYPSAPGLAPE